MTCFETIQDYLEGFEGFKVDFVEGESLKVFHYGTEIGTAQHQVSYIDVSSILINQLAKYDIDLENFMESQEIIYQIPKPKTTVKTYQVAIGLHFHIEWDCWHYPNSGTINGHYFCQRYDRERGNFIELVYNLQPYYSFSEHTPDKIQPYFDYIWKELEETGYIDYPQEIPLASKVAARIPNEYRVYDTDDEKHCKVLRFKNRFCYIKQLRENLYYTSFSDNPGLYPAVQSNNLDDAIAAVEEVLNLTYN